MGTIEDIDIDEETEVDPLTDIIDYLVRCANISFKNARVDESEIRTCDKIKMACDLYKKSPTDFLMQFGKYLAPCHVGYFENLHTNDKSFHACVAQLKVYHSASSRRKRVRNRRYNALKKLQNETEYFSEKQMMYRNPLLYEQLVGQYLTDDEVKARDSVDNENLTFLNMILDTVDHNEMRERKNEQLLDEDTEAMNIHNNEEDTDIETTKRIPQWGEFATPDTRPSFMPKSRIQKNISAPERNLLREEFLQEMYSSFLEGRDEEIDYQNVDSNELYDDLRQVSQDAEDQYFDSESNDIENLEEHMKLVDEYGKKKINDMNDDPLDQFMKHISNKLKSVYF